MHGGHGGIAYRIRAAPDTSVGAGAVSRKTRSAVGGAFSAHRGAYLAKQPGCGKLFGMLGRERVSGRADLGESNDGGNVGGHLVEPAEPFGSFGVGRPFPDWGRGRPT